MCMSMLIEKPAKPGNNGLVIVNLLKFKLYRASGTAFFHRSQLLLIKAIKAVLSVFRTGKFRTYLSRRKCLKLIIVLVPSLMDCNNTLFVNLSDDESPQNHSKGYQILQRRTLWWLVSRRSSATQFLKETYIDTVL